ncbi:hypothetical protein NC651_006970 [Populus alba x Populus x berolinensis]|nr:hypothetical protein NC651_006970 [Populus alba x Populus x berolinensis]
MDPSEPSALLSCFLPSSFSFFHTDFLHCFLVYFFA